MSEEKLTIIRNSVDQYKKLPKDKQMFVLGFMQGVLADRQEKNNLVDSYSEPKADEIIEYSK